MISQSSRIFSVEYTASGAAIMTADLLGLNARNVGVVDGDVGGSSSSLPSVSPDLVGLEFGSASSARPLTRHSSLTRPKPAECQSVSHRAGVVDGSQFRREAMVIQDNMVQPLAASAVNGTTTLSGTICDRFQHYNTTDSSRNINNSSIN